MNLTRLKPLHKSKRVKRVGRGCGSGHGKTSGRGHKGTGQRKGRAYYVGFNGGNLPYFRRIPKRGFTPPRRKEYQIVNLGEINDRLKEKKEITPEELKEVNLIKDKNKPVKILAKLKGEFTVRALFKAHKFSQKAKKLIETTGGKVECLEL